MKPVETFTIVPKGSRLKVQVRIFANRKHMLEGIRKDVIGGISNSTLACTVHQTKSTINDPAITSVVFFSKNHTERGTIAHEMVHVAGNIVERRSRIISRVPAVSIILDSKREEELAELTGDLVDAFYEKRKI